MKNSKKITILGAGGWGTALSVVLHHNKHNISLWEFNKDLAEKFKLNRENERFLPGIKIPSEINITSDLKEAVNEKEIVIFAVPSHVVREVAEKIKNFDVKDKILISAVKGVENNTLYRISEVLKDVLIDLSNDNIAVLSGPSHAEEVSRKIPTAVTIASRNTELAIHLQNVFMNPFFRVYASEDIIGVELGGSLKNVIAIAAGICDGAELGDNTKSALLTRGIAEITRLGAAMGAEPKTFSGLTGIGDLIVTCYSTHSRNRFVGEQIGKGKKLHDIQKDMVMVAEGIKTAESAYQLSIKYKVETPIIEKVYNILFNNENPKNAVYELMTREAKIEDWKIRKSI